MKGIHFLWFLLQRGSWSHVPVDFKAEREEILASLPLQKFQVQPERRKIASLSKAGFTFRANLSYLLHAGNMNTQLFVCPEKKLVYVRVLKAASTSMLKELLPSIDPQLEGLDLSDPQVDALAFYYVKKKLSTGEQQFVKLALIRNPFHRLVSVYLDLFDPAATHFSYDAYWFGIFKREMSFHEFVETISRIPEYWRGPHFASQYYILSKAVGIASLHWFRIDKDEEKLHDFLVPYRIKPGHHNRQGKVYGYGSFYSQETLLKAFLLYKKDVEHFGYESEYEMLRKSVSG